MTHRRLVIVFRFLTAEEKRRKAEAEAAHRLRAEQWLAEHPKAVAMYRALSEVATVPLIPNQMSACAQKRTCDAKEKHSSTQRAFKPHTFAVEQCDVCRRGGPEACLAGRGRPH